MSAGGERHSGDCPHGRLADGTCKDCEIEGLRKANKLLLAGMESQAELMDDLKQETRRLRAALKRIQEWDCLNPPNPDLCHDHPWLKRTVDDALAGEPYDMLTPRGALSAPTPPRPAADRSEP